MCVKIEEKLKIIFQLMSGQTVSEELKSAFYKAEELVEKCELGEIEAENLNMEKVKSHLEEFRSKVEKIIQDKETEASKRIDRRYK
jgi:hypothetical protein